MRYIRYILLLALVSCTANNALTDTSFALYYNGVSGISPGTVVNLTPSYHGDAPTDFEIVGARFEGQVFVTDCFTVDTATGVFRIVNSETLATGRYAVDIACTSAGKRHVFENAIEIHLMKPLPDHIKVEPSRMSIPLSDILGGEAELPKARIESDGSDHVVIKQFSIENIRRDGALVNECKDWFSLSQEGVFSVVPGNAAFIPGTYSFDFRLVTYIVGKDDDAGIFADALTVDVTSAPLALSYPVASARVERGYAATSPEPQLTGSLRGLRYAIKEVLPSNKPGISINETSGVLSFPATDAVSAGEDYMVSLTVSNEWGSNDFENVFNFSVIDYIHPVTILSYADMDEIISGLAFSHPVLQSDGDDVEFAFDSLPEGLYGLQINSSTGTVSCAAGVELVPGAYDVKVKASNVKSSVTASFALNVTANPYRFTYVRWGNNMGLTPVEEYGNQFRLTSGTIKVPIFESDIPAGQPVKFTIKNCTDNSQMSTGAAIDAATGELTLTYKGDQTADRSARTHASIITVTVGGNSEAAVTRKFPLFISHDGFIKGYKITYTPFAFRVNPRTGGRSVTPVVTREDGQPVNGFTLSYRRNVFFYNVGGPAEHMDGRAQDGTDRFMYGVWNKYYSARNLAVNSQSCAPVSWYADRNGEKGWLPYCACYNDPADLSLVVNPDKFSDENGYASGFVSGQMQFNYNNTDPVNTGGSECYPIIIWLDPSYNK
ncbi:MAG: DUF4958 family protein [Bacteroidales bacterium]|nr:DUF4958 family protein [Bacteroidales bacterium]